MSVTSPHILNLFFPLCIYYLLYFTFFENLFPIFLLFMLQKSIALSIYFFIVSYFCNFTDFISLIYAEINENTNTDD